MENLEASRTRGALTDEGFGREPVELEFLIRLYDNGRLGTRGSIKWSYTKVRAYVWVGFSVELKLTLKLKLFFVAVELNPANVRFYCIEQKISNININCDKVIC